MYAVVKIKNQQYRVSPDQAVQVPLLEGEAGAEVTFDEVLMLADGNAEFTKKIGMDFDGSGIGLGTRSKRYAMVVNDGVVEVLNTEESPGVADVSTAESMLEEI